MNELSQRLRKAVDFLKENGYAKSYLEIAQNSGIKPESLSMTKKGTRVPTWDLLLKICDYYPINFAWLRTGEGDMIKDYRELALLRKIAELEGRIRELEGK